MEPTKPSRLHPSAPYLKLLQDYAQLHALSPDMFAGNSLTPHIDSIKAMIRLTGAKTLLDYGAGKGSLYSKNFPDWGNQTLKDYWKLAEITLYDPGYPPLQQLPNHTFDAVICIDVLEHCPQEDIPWILEEIFTFSKKAVYLNIACFPSLKHFPDQTNCHVTIKSSQWWKSRIKPLALSKNIYCVAAFSEINGYCLEKDA